MPRNHDIQNSFKAGVMTPRAWGRTDIPAYANGLEVGDNFIINPQGGARRRPGREYLDELPAVAADTGHELIRLEYDGVWMIVIYDGNLRIYDDTGTYTTVTFVTPWDHTELARLQWGGYQHQLFFAHPDYAPQVLAYDIGTTTWTFGAADINIPQYVFPDGPASPPTAPDWTLNFTGTWASGDTFTLLCDNGETNAINWSSVEATLKSNIEAKLRAKLRDPEFGIFGDVEVTGTYPNLTVAYVDDMAGYSAMYKGTVTTAGSGDITAAVSTAGSGTASEPVWSATRGYPGSVVVHNQRLWLAGSRHLPQNLWGSVQGSFLDFGVDGLPAGGISYKLATNEACSIAWLASHDYLHVGTSRGDFIVDDSTAPIPTNVGRTAIRSEAIQPATVESEVMAITKGRKGLAQIQYDDATRSWLSRPLLELIEDRGETLKRITYSQDKFPYVFILRDDGEILCGQYGRELTPFTPLLVDKQVLAIATCEDGDDEYLWLVTLEENAESDIGLSRISLAAKRGFEHKYLDNWSTGSGTNITGLDRFNGETVSILADNEIEPDQVVAGGTLPTALDTATTIVVGQRYTSTLRTLPPAYAFPGTSLDMAVRLVRASAMLLDSGAFTMNGQEVPVLPDTGNLDASDALLNGVIRIPDVGYGDGVIEIETSDPTPLEITAIPSTVAAHGGG